MLMKAVKFLLLTLCFLLVLSAQAGADTIYLKNGRSMEGIIKNESDDEIELEIGLGAVKFLKKDVERVYKSTPEESDIIRESWQENKRRQEQLRQEKAREEELKKLRKEVTKSQQQKIEDDTTFEGSGPKAVPLTGDAGNIRIDVVLNQKEQVNMLLDTGAGLVIIPDNVAKKLWVFKKSGSNIKLVSANGGITNATYVLLESVRVQGVEARNVDAAILPEDAAVFPGMGGGVLGMSFLKKFNFTFDSKNKKLILEKIQ